MSFHLHFHWISYAIGRFVQVFSYLVLRGKCRYCGAKISIQYPLVELANGILYVLVVAFCGLNPDSILWCVLTSIMIVIAVTDLKTMKFPAVCEILMIVVGAVHLFLHASQWLYYIAGALFMGVFLLVCALLFKKITGKAARNYLSNRGINEETIKEFEIGLSLDTRDDLTKLLVNKKYDLGELNRIGLSSDDHDIYNDRIMFPLYNVSGQVVGFSGRIYNDNGQNKYLNTKETDMILRILKYLI